MYTVLALALACCEQKAVSSTDGQLQVNDLLLAPKPKKKKDPIDINL